MLGSRLLKRLAVSSPARRLVSAGLPRLAEATLSRESIAKTRDVDEEGNGVVVREDADREFREETRQKFIPVTRRALVRRLAEEEGLLSWDEKRLLENLAAALDARFSQRFKTLLEETKHLYDAMDPDKDTVVTRQLTRKELLGREDQLLQLVGRLLDKANYFMIPPDQLKALLRDHDTHGLRVSVDPGSYDTLLLWTRGRSPEHSSSLLHRARRLLQSSLPRRPRAAATRGRDTHTRVFVALRFRSEKKLHLKIFKEVACDKLEYLLPDGTIKMSKYDMMFLGGSVAAGSALVGLRSLPMLDSYQLHWMWAGLGLAALAGGRAWVGYRNKRNKYLASLAATLYFKTVANNRGVLTLLADRAVDEEFKEALLAYVFLLSPPNRRGVPGTAHTASPPVRLTSPELRARVEGWLGGWFGLRGLQFDVDDALDKLGELGILRRHTDGTLSVLSLPETMQLLPRPALQWRAGGVLREEEEGEGKDGEEAERHRWR